MTMTILHELKSFRVIRFSISNFCRSIENECENDHRSI